MIKYVQEVVERLFFYFQQPELQSDKLDKRTLEMILADAGKDEKFVEALKAIAKGDRLRYFRAMNDAQRERIKGEYLRTLFLIQGMEKKKSKINTKIANRYG